MCARCARTTSTAVTSPDRTRAAISVAGSPTRAPLASMHGTVATARDTSRREARMAGDREQEAPYTGDVTVGGPADVRELPGLVISKLAVSEMSNNAYLLRDPGGGEALLIDAAAEPEALLSLIGNADLRTVVTTHGHWDHHRALPQVVEATGAVTVAHPADAADLPVPVQRPVEHGDTVSVGDQNLRVVDLRGQTRRDS